MWNSELTVAKSIAIEAGHAIMEIYDSTDLKIEYKKNESPLTIADKKSNEIIVKKLRDEFPDYALLSEEEQDNKSRLKNELCFIVDPLDGTKEFIKHNGQFTVNIALAHNHKSVMGVIYVPATEEMYWATEGDGAYKQSSDGTIDKINVSNISDLGKVRVVMSSSHGCSQMDDLIDKYKLKNYIKIGSSLKGCLIAEANAEIYYRFNPTMEWDTAAMQCIVEEAGGIFRQMDDTEMLYNRSNSLNDKGFYAINCASNKLN